MSKGLIERLRECATENELTANICWSACELLTEAEEELAAAIAQRDRLEVALKTIEGHHNENDSWRDIAREALKECGK